MSDYEINIKDVEDTEQTKFSVFTLYDCNDQPEHWSKGITVHIKKNNISMILTADEIKELIKCLPRTFGSTY